MKSNVELHGAPTGNCLRAAVALEELKIPYEAVRVDLRSGQHYSASHLALNPAGKVPTLVDRSLGPEPFVLSQSNAIIFYLDNKFPDVLFPTEIKSRAIAFERFFYFVTDVIAPGMAAFRTRGSDQAQQVLLNSALSAWMESERFLEKSPFMAGDDFSAADIAAAVFILNYHRHLDWSEVPLLERSFKAVSSRPTFQRGVQAFD